jgi:hypothetical protein
MLKIFHGLLLLVSLLPACSFGPNPRALVGNHGPKWNSQYQLGVRSAKADIKRGTLAWETQANGEWERWRMLWCLRRILAEKYGVEYRVRGHYVPADNDARIEGYQSVMNPYLSARLGTGWQDRIFGEAEAFYRKHWHEVERQFFIDEPEQPGYEDYVRRHPISTKERQMRNPLDKFYNYRDEDPKSGRS